MLQISSYYHDVVLSYHDNILITCTKIYPFCNLRTAFDIVFTAVSDCGYDRERSLRKYMFYKCEHILDCKGHQT